MTSGLCSITITEWPRSTSEPRASISLTTSTRMQPGGGLVEQKDRVRLCAGAFECGQRARQEARELEPLRLAAGERAKAAARVSDSPGRCRASSAGELAPWGGCGKMREPRARSGRALRQCSCRDRSLRGLRGGSACPDTPGSAREHPAGTACRSSRIRFPDSCCTFRRRR